MLFNTLKFLIFFTIAYLVYLVIPKRGRKIFLLGASYFFYMCWNPVYILLLLGSTLVTWLCGLLLPKYGKKILITSLVLNFGLLFVFKYLDFSYGILSKSMGFFGVSMPEFVSTFLLPVGISFYIFQAVGYTIDVYRGDTEPEKNLLTYALFVAFFPQLVAGPIERSKRLLTQIKNLDTLKVWNFEAFQSGLITAVYGFFLKMVIADRAAIYVDAVFDATDTLVLGFPVIIAMVLFSLQIYCDFAGYTYIAIGVAKMMSIDLCINFKEPYLATSVKDFWDRWHISLSTYFRDYLYFPLGGSRKGKLRKYINLMIVFLVSGLWHGAAMHFIVWGAIHGLGRVIGECTKNFRETVKNRLQALGLMNFERFSYRLSQQFFTFSFVTLAWVFFRAKSIPAAIHMVKNAFTAFNPWTLTDGTLFSFGLDSHNWNILLFAILILIIIDCFKYSGKDLKGFILSQNPPFRIMLFLLMVLFIVVAGVYGPSYNASQFIYFQF